MPNDQELAAVADDTAGEDRANTDGELVADGLSTESGGAWVFCTISHVPHCVSCGLCLIAKERANALCGRYCCRCGSSLPPILSRGLASTLICQECGTVGDPQTGCCKKRVYVQSFCVSFFAMLSRALSIVGFLVLCPDMRKELSFRVSQFFLDEALEDVSHEELCKYIKAVTCLAFHKCVFNCKQDS